MQYPARYTAPLVADAQGFAVHSDGYRLITLIEKFWKLPNGSKVTLDKWQRLVLINVLERYPDDWEIPSLQGELRYRQVLISMGRQNGKSEIASWIGLYLLFQHVKGPQVLGISRNVQQASIIYDRVARVITDTPAMSHKVKPTGTRGIKFKDGSGSYTVKPAKEEAVQGYYATGAFADELHLLKRSLYDAIVNGQRAQPESLFVGITTAGDDTSELLISLYERADESIENPESRFGAFIWEAPQGSKLDDHDAIKAANPAIECGRIDIETVIQDVKTEPEFSKIRYLHNRFVSNINTWIDPHHWRLCGGDGIKDLSNGVYVAIDVAPSMAYASIVACKKNDKGQIETEVMASVTNPDLATLKRLVDGLKYTPEAFVLDPYRLRELGDYLEKKGRTVIRMDGGGNQRAAATAYALISQHKVQHNRDELMKRQMGNGAAKQKGDSWRIVRSAKGADIDTLMAFVYSAYAAETQEKQQLQIYVA